MKASVADEAQEREAARGEALYDSAEHRRELAAEQEPVADDETVEAHLVGDTSMAQPVSAVSSERAPRAPRAGAVRSGPPCAAAQRPRPVAVPCRRDHVLRCRGYRGGRGCSAPP